MTYETNEISNAGGQPVMLYEFKLGNTYYRYCTADEDQIVDGAEEDATWTALPIMDEGIQQGGNDRNDLVVNISSEAEVSQLFRGGRRPSGKLFLTVRRWHLDDDRDQVAVQWVGSVTNSILIDRSTAALQCRSIAGSYDRNGLRLHWSRMCPHVLYGVGCNLDKSNHAYEHEVATVTGTGFTVVAYAAPSEGTFNGGFLEYTRDDGSFERLGIRRHDGNDFQTLGAPAGLEVGTEITLYPGCARTTTVCKLFGNLANYGGFPHMPGKSPFDGTPVF